MQTTSHDETKHKKTHFCIPYAPGMSLSPWHVRHVIYLSLRPRKPNYGCTMKPFLADDRNTVSFKQSLRVIILHSLLRSHFPHSLAVPACSILISFPNETQLWMHIETNPAENQKDFERIIQLHGKQHLHSELFTLVIYAFALKQVLMEKKEWL